MRKLMAAAPQLVAAVMAVLLLAAEARANGPQRVVAVGSAVVETLYALGLEDRIAAVDTTAVFPARALKQKPNVGYMRALSPEGVLALAPDLILAAESAGPEAAVAVLKQSSVPYVSIPTVTDPRDVPATIRLVGRAMGVEREAEELAAAVAEDIATVAAEAERVGDRRKAIFVLSLQGGRIIAAGRDTTAAGIIALAGGENALPDFEGYKQTSDEAVLAAAPEAVIAMNRETHPVSAEAVFATAALASTPAARDQRFIAMDGTLLLGFGPRTAHAARALARALYPDASQTPLPDRAWTRDE